jgi:hypothetical protein
VSHLGNLTGHKLGPNTLQKVMAGDLVATTTEYYCQTANGGNDTGITVTVLSNAISSRKLPDAAEGTIKNQYQFQGAFAEFKEDVQLTDFELRNYDQQSGRWLWLIKVGCPIFF